MQPSIWWKYIRRWEVLTVWKLPTFWDYICRFFSPEPTRLHLTFAPHFDGQTRDFALAMKCNWVFGSMSSDNRRNICLTALQNFLSQLSTVHPSFCTLLLPFSIIHIHTTTTAMSFWEIIDVHLYVWLCRLLFLINCKCASCQSHDLFRLNCRLYYILFCILFLPFQLSLLHKTPIWVIRISLLAVSLGSCCIAIAFLWQIW